MTAPDPTRGRSSLRTTLWDLLTFEKMLTGPVAHLIYWAGLGLIALIGFTILGGAVGLGIRDGSLMGVALAFATLVAGVLLLAALVLIWRGMNEFFLAVFSIAEDLHALRRAAEAERATGAHRAPARTPGAGLEI